MKKFIALALVLGLTACAQAPREILVNDNVTEEQRTRDSARCENEAMKIDTADYEFQGTMFAGANIDAKRQRVYKNCMIAQGYDLVKENELDAYRERKAAEKATARKTGTKRTTRRR